MWATPLNLTYKAACGGLGLWRMSISPFLPSLPVHIVFPIYILELTPLTQEAFLTSRPTPTLAELEG